MTSSERCEFDKYNDSELYQVCLGAGIQVRPGTEKKLMISYILGKEEPPLAENPLDDWRIAIMNFVADHWEKLRTQLTCPARTKDPRACFQCVDMQVAVCLTQNEENIRFIQLHLPKKPGEPT